MKQTAKMAPVLLLLFVASCGGPSESEIVGTWAWEGYAPDGTGLHSRMTFNADGTCESTLYSTESLKPDPSDVVHRHLQALKKGSAMYLVGTRTGTWKLKDGSMIITYGSDTLTFKFDEFTDTRAVTTDKNGTSISIKLGRWKKMTDAEIEQYHKESEALKKEFLEKNKKD